jgi:hypothetical protein
MLSRAAAAEATTLLVVSVNQNLLIKPKSPSVQQRRLN